MKTHASSKLSWWLAGAYFAWSCLVYFGTMGREGHDWWPVFLFLLIVPWSLLYQFVLDPLLEHWLIQDPHTAPVWIWMLNDYIAGAFYIIVGTVWFWFVGKWACIVLKRPHQS